MTDQLTEDEAEILVTGMEALEDWCDEREELGIPIGHSYSAILAFADALRQAQREMAH